MFASCPVQVSEYEDSHNGEINVFIRALVWKCMLDRQDNRADKILLTTKRKFV